MKTGTASKLESGQLAELASAIIRQLPHLVGLGEVAQDWIENGAALKNVLQKALVPPMEKSTRSWREQDGIIYFTVTSDGTTGPQWKERLKKKGLRVSGYAESLLCSKDFKPTKGVTTEVAVFKGELFTDSERTTHNIRLRAVKNKMILPEAEVACLIREKFSDKEIEAMGLWWITVMHEPIKDSDGSPRLLSAYRRGDGRWLRACYGSPVCGWSRADGLAFAVSQVP